MSTSLGARGSSSEARDDSEVEEEEGRGLSEGEMLAEEAGVESVVGSRRIGASCCRAVVDIAWNEGTVEIGCMSTEAEQFFKDSKLILRKSW